MNRLSACRSTGTCCASKATIGCVTGTRRFVGAAASEKCPISFGLSPPTKSLSSRRPRKTEIRRTTTYAVPCLEGNFKALRLNAGGERHLPGDRARRILWLAWSLRLRQDHDLAHDRGSGKTGDGYHQLCRS